jgi:hypothetical protein
MEASPWQRGRRYELKVAWDDDQSVCNFEVPLRRTRSLRLHGVDPRLEFECDEYSTFVFSPSGEPSGLTPVSGKPSQVSVEILSGDVVFYRGAASARYGEPLEGCSHDIRLMLRSITPDEK